MLFVLPGLLPAVPTPAGETELNGQKFRLPDGYEIQHVAGNDLVERPVSADFDEQGRLYVTDSSGSNELLTVQQETRPHRIMRLEDTDGDGVFDRSVQYADRLMFPEGAMWYDGSLYVAAPPEIWKFTDADDDGVAEHREIWFDGKTVTHCGNDLHGPFLGPDGWIYWCKGAFAEQTYEQPGRKALVTKASHIFRRRPEGGPIESVMAGGMDNPVELVFTPGGERIMCCTFLVRPRQGQRDGLIHAIYGGVYGKNHSVIDNHPRTGDLMPVLAHLGVAAPAGLACLSSDGMGADWQHNLLTSCFNLRTVMRQQLRPQGAALTCESTNLLSSDSVDFHPTDVLEDADGSVLVVDTGGWYKLCCPTSQLEKPDVLGGIYRIRRTAARPIQDPRGLQLDWERLGPEQLVDLLNDERFAVRQRARQQLADFGPRATTPLSQVLTEADEAAHRREAVWALTWIDHNDARAAVRRALRDTDETVRQAAIHSASVRQDPAAADQLRTLLTQGSPQNARAAAEALGRIGSPEDIPRLLNAVAEARLQEHDGFVVDRVLEHSLIYAAMELNSPEMLRRSLASSHSRIQRAALIALDQLDGGAHLTADDIRPLLLSEDEVLNDVAWWIAQHHADWGNEVVDAFRQELRHPPTDSVRLERLAGRLQHFAAAPAVREAMAAALNRAVSDEFRGMLLTAMAGSGRRPLPTEWVQPLLQQLTSGRSSPEAVLHTVSQLSKGQADEALHDQLTELAARDTGVAEATRLQALKLLPAASRPLQGRLFEFVLSQLDLDLGVGNRSLAVDILTSTPLDAVQLQRVARQLPETGVMELRPLMNLFSKSQDPQVGAVLVASLLEAPAATSLFPEHLTSVLAGFGDGVSGQAAPLLQRIEQENSSKVARVNEILELLPQADIRRGIEVFQSSAASCLACHRRAYLGGHIGPDLSNIGTARSERDLVESILFPSLTFVRSYEPVSILTVEGRVFNGIIRAETSDTITLQLDAQKSVDIPKADIDEQQMGNTSIMPEGLDKQLTPQQLADLVKYLKEG